MSSEPAPAPGAVPVMKTADIELLLAVCKQFGGHVDSKKLGEELGCTANAAFKRWTRFKERTFGTKEIGYANDDGVQGEGEGSVPKTPKAKGGAAKNGGRKFQFYSFCGNANLDACDTASAKKSSGKRGRGENDGRDGADTPVKKASTLLCRFRLLPSLSVLFFTPKNFLDPRSLTSQRFSLASPVPRRLSKLLMTLSTTTVDSWTMKALWSKHSRTNLRMTTLKHELLHYSPFRVDLELSSSLFGRK
jgi:Myb-like DNA-binding domain